MDCYVVSSSPSSAKESCASEREEAHGQDPLFDSYLMTMTCFQPLYGKLSDIFGRKFVLIFSYAMLGTGCLLCGLSQNLSQLVAARVSTHALQNDD